jgi:pyruvate/2-oxoglutarate/acetoin dehydrogenase E1 component
MSAALPFDQALQAAVAAALAADPARMVVTEDALAPWPAVQRLLVPVSDRAALGVALGCCLAGRPTIVEVVGSGRVPALAELLAEAGAIAEAGEFPVPLLVRVPWGAEAVGLDQPAGRWLLDVPGVAVVAASSGAHAVALFEEWLAKPSPTVLLEPRALGRERAAHHTSTAPTVVREGSHVVLAAYGAHVGVALAAAASLAAEGVEATVLDLVRVAPFPAEALSARVRAVGRLVFVGDDPVLARRAREAATDGAFEYLESPPAVSAAALEPVRAAVHAALAW